MVMWPSRSTGGGHGRRQRLLALCCVALAAALLQLQGATAAFVPPSPTSHRPALRPQRLQQQRRAAASSHNHHDTHEHEEPSTPAPASPPSVSRRHALSLGGRGGGAMAALLLLAGSRPAQAVEGLEVQGYVDQLRQAMPVKTIRGVWRIREYRSGDSGPLCKGRIKMKGFVEEPNKGTLEYYDGCDGGKGRGNWLLKPARIADGQIRFSARWKVRFADGDALIYRGDVLAGDGFSKATAQITKGEILKPVTGITGNLTERKIGTFEAELIEPSEDEEKL